MRSTNTVHSTTTGSTCFISKWYHYYWFNMLSRSRSAAVIFLAPSFMGAGFRFGFCPETPRDPIGRDDPTLTCPPIRDDPDCREGPAFGAAL
jgi:hypothetical protein